MYQFVQNYHVYWQMQQPFEHVRRYNFYFMPVCNVIGRHYSMAKTSRKKIPQYKSYAHITLQIMFHSWILRFILLVSFFLFFDVFALFLQFFDVASFNGTSFWRRIPILLYKINGKWFWKNHVVHKKYVRSCSIFYSQFLLLVLCSLVCRWFF